MRAMPSPPARSGRTAPASARASATAGDTLSQMNTGIGPGPLEVAGLGGPSPARGEDFRLARKLSRHRLALELAEPRLAELGKDAVHWHPHAAGQHRVHVGKRQPKLPGDQRSNGALPAAGEPDQDDVPPAHGAGRLAASTAR